IHHFPVGRRLYQVVSAGRLDRGRRLAGHEEKGRHTERRTSMDPRPVTLIGEHVRLEPLSLAHGAELGAAFCVDPSIWAWPSPEPADGLAAMEALVAEALRARALGGEIAFAQVEIASGRAIGSTRYLNISRRDRGLEIGWTWIGKPWQRTAINTEAKYLLL